MLRLGKLTWTAASSPKAEQDNVGVIPKNPESATSSTVSPIESTNVAFTNDTMMYASYSSETQNFRCKSFDVLNLLLYYKTISTI